MSAVFLKILNMSITAGWLILAVLLIRLLLKKAPRWISCVLWALVAVRLICPFSPESIFSLIPSQETVPSDIALSHAPAIDSGVAVINRTVNPILSASFTPDPASSANPLQIVIPLAAIIWIAGAAAMLLYALISYLRLRKTVSASVSVGDRIMACDDIGTPFILGLFRPIVYVPSSLNEETLAFVTRHEKAHLKRRDHWWKPLGFLLLAVYWSNPLCWIAYILLCRDIEMACDERVIRDMDKDDKAAYSQALLDCSFSRRRVVACPLAFGEVGVKERVKGILNYKKPAFWIILIAVLACIVLAVCLMTDPSSGSNISFGNIQLSWVKALDLRPNEPTTRDLTRDELEELKSRLAVLKIGKRDDDLGGITPYYSLSAYSSQTGQFLIAGFDYEGNDIGIMYRDHYYRIYDDGFADYLSRVCAGISTVDAPFGHCYAVQEIQYEVKRSGGSSAIPLCEYCLSDEKELLILEDLNSDNWLNAGTFTKTDLSKDTFDKCFPDDGRSIAAYLRSNNAKAWRVIVSYLPSIPDSVFYYLLLQKDGEVCLTRGYYDATEKDDPNSDDTRISYVFLLKETDTHDEIDMESLREKYPEYFDLSTFKGLEVYVWQMAPDSYSFGVLSGTNREKQLEELMNMKGASTDEMRAILSTYDVDERDISVIPWQNPISSYMSEYWILEEGEGPDSVSARRQAYIDGIREMLFGERLTSGPENAEYDVSTGELFDIIMSSPVYSSNPGDYLQAHEEEHQQLLADQTGTLQYIFAEFLNARRTGTGQTGLKGHIMRIVLDELAPEAKLSIGAAGQAYFDAWLAYAERLEAQNGADWMKENQPAMYLLLQMAAE